MFQLIITLLLVTSATIYAVYKLVKSVFPGKQAIKKGCSSGCAHCMQ